MITIEGEGMEILFFVYGLSFFVLGVSVLFARPKESEYFFASKIWLLGVFAILHAFEDWISLFTYIHSETDHSYLNPIQSALLLISYIFLFEFSRFVIRKSFLKSSRKSGKYLIHKLYYPPAIYSFVTLGLLFLMLLHPTINGINAAIRYTYGFWGAFILGIGLYFYGDSFKKSHYTHTLKLYFKINGVAFVLYAFFSGIVVHKISYFPGNIINTESFIQLFHLPVQVFRGICALIIAVASIRVLSLFKYELMEKVYKSYNNIRKFSSNASHQLKTPLTSLGLQIHMALKVNRTVREYRETLNSIDGEIVFLQKMINNLLLLTRIQDMHIRDSFKVIDLDGVLMDVYEEYVLVARTKGVVLDIGALEYKNILGEPTLLRVLLSNLVDNAIKFTPKGKKIILSLADGVLSVSDEGRGMISDEIPMIFDEFYRINTLDEEHVEGYGLGLTMVKQIADMHKAIIDVQSHPGIGSTITVTFVGKTRKI